MIFLLGWLLWVIKIIAPKSVVNTTQIGLAMINIIERGYKKQIVNPIDIQILSE